MIEEFKEIEGFDGKYLISNTGMVISKNTTDKNGRTRSGKVLQQKFIKGYVKVGLLKDKIQIFCSVADLVLKHFSKEWKDGCINNVTFLDENAFNCKLDNLKILDYPISIFHRSILESKARKLIKQNKQIEMVQRLPPLIKIETPKKEHIKKNSVKVSLVGDYDDKVNLIKNFRSLCDEYHIEIIDNNNIVFKNKMVKNLNIRPLSKKVKITPIKPPPVPLGFCTIPGYKGKYIISKEGKIQSVIYNKNKKEWVYKELKYKANKSSLNVDLNINGKCSTRRVAALMVSVFANVKNTYGLRFDYKDSNYKNVSFDNIIFD